MITQFKVIKARHRSYGYSLVTSQGKKPSWIIGESFGWYRYKKDAVSRMECLNKAEFKKGDKL